MVVVGVTRSIIASDAGPCPRDKLQLNNPGVYIPGAEPCIRCKIAPRDPHHNHLACAFWIRANYKKAGHRENVCTNPFAP